MDAIHYLRSLPAIRDRVQEVFAIGLKNHLHYFDVDLSAMPAVTQFVIDLIQRDCAFIFHMDATYSSCTTRTLFIPF